MSSAAPSISPILSDELVVTITFDAATGKPVIEPDVLKVPFGFRGFIRWHIVHPDAVFESPAVIFDDGPRTVPPPPTPKSCHLWWENANTGSATVSYHYKVCLEDGLIPTTPDPTVENDPPGYRV